MYLTFEQGFVEAIRRIVLVSDRPILVAVYGQPNSGKTFLIDRLKAHFSPHFDVRGHGGHANEGCFRLIAENMEHYQNSLVLYHCGYERIKAPDGSPFLLEEDPSTLAKKILNRRLNLNIGILPKTSPLDDITSYDIKILNPAALVK